MALTSEQIQAKIDALTLAIGSGAKVVQFSDRRIEYQSTNDMVTALQLLQSELVEGSPTQPSRHIRLYTSKGF